MLYFDRGKIIARRARGGRARGFVNIRKFSSCIAHARPARAGLTVYPRSRTLGPLAFDEYCRFDTSKHLLLQYKASLICAGNGLKSVPEPQFHGDSEYVLILDSNLREDLTMSYSVRIQNSHFQGRDRI